MAPYTDRSRHVSAASAVDEWERRDANPAGETYWKAANGIRLTGMPAYGSSPGETQI
jgi:hypothetical protein